MTNYNISMMRKLPSVPIDKELVRYAKGVLEQGRTPDVDLKDLVGMLNGYPKSDTEEDQTLKDLIEILESYLGAEVVSQLRR